MNCATLCGSSSPVSPSPMMMPVSWSGQHIELLTIINKVWVILCACATSLSRCHRSEAGSTIEGMVWCANGLPSMGIEVAAEVLTVVHHIGELRHLFAVIAPICLPGLCSFHYHEQLEEDESDCDFNDEGQCKSTPHRNERIQEKRCWEARYQKKCVNLRQNVENDKKEKQ